MKILIGSDHAGFKLKNSMKLYLSQLGVEFKDLGAFKLKKEDDYPVYAFKVGKEVARNKSLGILFCGSSHGMCITANKVKGIRAVAVNNITDAVLTREHNNANILCLSGWNTKKEKAQKIIKTWLFTMFTNEKNHKRRIKMISNYENSH